MSRASVSRACVAAAAGFPCLRFLAALCLAALFFAPASLSAQTAASASAASGASRAALSEIFGQKDYEAMRALFSSKLAALANSAEKRQLLSVFADYEERAGYFESAAAHYEQAAVLVPADYTLSLHAARCLMYVNDADGAAELVQKTLLECFEPDVLCRARFYSACIQLGQGDTAGAFALLRAYSANTAFRAFYPQMLFVLWYAADDAGAKSRLLSEYPDSLEAALVRGEADLSPQAFWYLMPVGERRAASRNELLAGGGGTPARAVASSGRTSAAAASGSSSGSGTTAGGTGGTGSAGGANGAGNTSTAPAVSADPVAKGIWQQTGFFQSRANAEALAEELSQAGFRVFIRQEKRGSGVTCFSVLIPEDEAGTTALRLKDRGFESYLVID